MRPIRTKRAYDEASESDGVRVLVDRLWPRGVTKERAALAEWAKDAAPSTELRRWFDHDPEKWDEFRRRYLEELTSNQQTTQGLLQRLRRGELLTLVYSCRDEQRNHAVVLARFLADQVGPAAGTPAARTGSTPRPEGSPAARANPAASSAGHRGERAGRVRSRPGGRG